MRTEAREAAGMQLPRMSCFDRLFPMKMQSARCTIKQKSEAMRDATIFGTQSRLPVKAR